MSDITINGLDKRRALERFSGDKTVFIDVLRSYAANTRPILTNLTHYLTEENFAAYAIAVHGIKSSSYAIFAQDVGKMAELLEYIAKTGNFEAVRMGHFAFSNSVETLLNEIDKALAKVDAAADKPAAAAPDPAVLQELRSACQAFNMDRIDAAMARLESFRYERGEKLVVWLRGQVNKMAFEKISRLKLPGVKKTILTVSDLGAILRNVKGSLEGKYNVAVANSYAMAGKYLSLGKPDLILLDSQMPVCDGKSVLEMIQADIKFAGIPVVFFTSKRDKETAISAQNSNTPGYLLKPINADAIIKAVDDFFANTLLPQKQGG